MKRKNLPVLTIWPKKLSANWCSTHQRSPSPDLPRMRRRRCSTRLHSMVEC
jgi:hypothetical protein